VPRQVREALGAVPGDDLLFELREGGIIVRREPRKSVLAFAGVASDTAPACGLTGADLTAATERAIGEAYADKLARMQQTGATRPARRRGTALGSG
jgi:bifunctional DNA-binding transcriptional regulator/antitoxin component of YhaV-PrlF toxin-antitoxin module